MPSKSRLLLRDEEELEHAAHLLRRGGPLFLILVCPTSLQAEATTFIRGRIPEFPLDGPQAVEDPDLIPAMLEEAARAGATLSITPTGPDVTTAINWHREKLRRGSATVLLWLDGIESLRAFRQKAPDAYSFRDAMYLLQGYLSEIGIAKVKEPEEIAAARRRWARAKGEMARAHAARELAAMLRGTDHVEEARRVATEALARLTPVRFPDDDAAALRGTLAFELAAVAASDVRAADAFRWTQRSLAESQNRWSPECVDIRLWASAIRPPTFAPPGRSALLQVLTTIRRDRINDPNLVGQALRSLTLIEQYAGNIHRARRWIRQQPPGRLDANVANTAHDAALVEQEAGDLVRAEALWRQAVETQGRAHRPVRAASTAVGLCACLVERGEHRAAEHALDEVQSLSFESGKRHLDLLAQRASLFFTRGDVAGALASLRDSIVCAATEGRDGRLYTAGEALVLATLEGFSAKRIDEEMRKNAEIDLEVAADSAIAIAGPEPSWYVILFPGLRAQLLALDDANLERAISLERDALALALKDWPELAPACGRALGTYLLRAGQFEESRRVLLAAAQSAKENENPRERARSLAALLRVAVASGEPAEVAESTLRAVRETIAPTDNRRLLAETLLDIARELPPVTTVPDPLPLAEEAFQLFLEMPMPGREALALEVAGDILRARGRTVEARRRYLTARGRCESYGLELRVPLLTQKIGELQ